MTEEPVHYRVFREGLYACNTKIKSNRKGTGNIGAVTCVRCRETGVYYMHWNAPCARCKLKYEYHIDGKCPFAPTHYVLPERFP